MITVTAVISHRRYRESPLLTYSAITVLRPRYTDNDITALKSRRKAASLGPLLVISLMCRKHPRNANELGHNLGRSDEFLLTLPRR